MIIGAHQLASLAILIGGSDTLKHKYLSKMNKGELISAFSLTEPQAGSDPTQIKTTATLDGDYYILNGTKAFVTNAGLADAYVVFAKQILNLVQGECLASLLKVVLMVFL